VADARDHGRVIQGVGIHDALRDQPGERGQGGLVRHIAGSEDEGCLLAVQIRKFALEQDVITGVA
jgi:hypothetical protein